MAPNVRADHCWHTEDLAVIKSVKAVVIPIICCHCGKKDQANLVIRAMPGHGRHAMMEQPHYPKPSTCVEK